MDNTILLAAQSLAELLGWTILHSIWQITLIALVLRLLLSWTSKYDATIRYALSISALFLATFWSAPTFIGELNQVTFTANQAINSSSEGNNTIEISTTAITFSPSSYLKKVEVQAAKLIAPMMPFLAIFWFIGILFFASRILVGLFQLHHFSNNGIQLLPSSWDTRLLKLKHLSGIHRPIRVRLSNLVETPITYRFVRPIILLPFSLFTGLSDEQIEVILLHELAHIKRQDYLVNLLQSCIEVLFFYHPLIWWMSKQVRLEREHCCDDRVLKLRHNPMLYAQTLTQIQAQQHYSLKTKLAMSATGNTGDFSTRIYRLFQQKEPSATLRNSAAALLLLLFSGAMMAFYPRNADLPSMNNSAIPTVMQDTIPQKLHQQKTGEENSWVEKTDSKTSIKNEVEINALQTELVKLEKELHQNIKTLKEEKTKAGALNEPKLEALQLKAGQLKKELHSTTQELKKLTSNNPKGFRINANENKPFSLKMANGLLTLNVLKGKKPIVYLDNEIYKKWKIDEEGTLIIDVPSEDVHSINIFKEEKAVALFGPAASEGIVYINTKANPNPDVIINEKKRKLQLETSDKKPLVVVNGKVSKQVVEDINPDNIATINVLGGETAIKLYGNKGKDDVIEIYTKDYEPKAASDNKTLTGKIAGNSFTLKSDTPDKKPLMVIDGKVSQKEMKDLNTHKIGVMNVLKGKAALEKYGDAGKDGVVEVFTKGNEPKESSTKLELKNSSEKEDRKIKLNSKGENEKLKPLFIIDSEKLPNGEATMEEFSPDDIAHINVIKGAAALEKYGKEGANGVVEIITKANKKAIKVMEKEQKAKQQKIKVKEKELKAIKKERKVKEKALKAKKEQKIQKEKEYKKRKLVKEAKEKELKARKKELKAIKPVIAGNDIESPAAHLSVFPNPTRRLTNVQLNLEEKGNVKVDILNVNGQVVLNLVNGVLEKGLHQFQWNSDNEPAGSYFVHFNLDGELMSKQIVVKK